MPVISSLITGYRLLITVLRNSEDFAFEEPAERREVKGTKVKNKEEVSDIPKDQALEIIKNNLSGNNLMLCDDNFTRMMVFFYLSKVE